MILCNGSQNVAQQLHDEFPKAEGYLVCDVVELRETTSCLHSDTLADACSKLCQSGRTAVVVLGRKLGQMFSKVLTAMVLACV